MAHDETEFDKLLKETREWEARDRARHKSSGMKDEGGAEPFPAPSRAPTVTIEELEKRTAVDLGRKPEPPPKVEMPKPAAAIKVALKTAMKQAQAQQAADRTRKKGGWGWIWVVILLYFIIKHFAR